MSLPVTLPMRAVVQELLDLLAVLSCSVASMLL